ncbi:MAG: ABC transporter permease [Tissierellaceae bacterium]|nr:ABC transporter permease [Tissierellaceae bacterium]
MKNNKSSHIFKSLFNALKQPLIASIFGLIVGAIVIIISKENPIEIYAQMFEKSFFDSYYLMQTLSRSTPIIICAIATAAAWRAGYINIGVEGQMIVGGFVSTVCALYIPGPPTLVMIISIIMGMIAGALYAVIAAVLNIKYNVSIVICTLMTNYIANYIATYFVTFPLKDTSGDGLAAQSFMIDEGMRFFKFNPMSTLNIGFIIAILVTILFLYLSNKTTFGYESKMTGLNPNFAKYGGVKEKNVMLMTMALSGAIAALAGSTEIFGVKYRYIDAMFTSTSYAWTGLMSALIAALNPIGMFFSSVFLAGLQVGGQSIQRSSNVPLQMATVIQSCITLFVSIKLTFSFIKRKKGSKVKTATEDIGGDK